MTNDSLLPAYPLYENFPHKSIGLSRFEIAYFTFELIPL